MEFHLKLPRNKKEFILFMAIISVISVNIIAPLITCFELGFRLQTWANALKVVPFIWMAVVALVFITYKPAEWLTNKIIEQGDSFNAHILINILCTVFLMSIFLTVIGTWIGTGHVNIDPIRMFFYKWPRNAAISFFVEACIAQPVARAVMAHLHNRIDRAHIQLT